VTPDERAALAPAIEFMRVRKAAYQRRFGMLDDNDEVMKDLTRFCRGHTTCFHADPRIHAAFEGRREVWQRIRDHLELTPEELAVKYGATVQNPQGDNDG
jgi:hypothetical protein